MSMSVTPLFDDVGDPTGFLVVGAIEPANGETLAVGAGWLPARVGISGHEVNGGPGPLGIRLVVTEEHMRQVLRSGGEALQRADDADPVGPRTLS